MVLGRIFHALINNARVVERLAESRPIRRAAQITAFAITKAQIAGRDASMKLLRSHAARQIAQTPRGAARLTDAFMKELREGLRDARRQIKDRK